jgi:cyclophilin family peptidyl-prolyl cis-trans isomerase
LLAVLSLIGCDRGGTATPEAITDKTVTPSAAPAATGAATADGTGSGVALSKSFAEAMRLNPPDTWQPPEKTVTGKSVGKLYEEIVNRWDSIRLVTEAGQPIHYVATLETELGNFDITLRPELAPNHVRNFVALTQVGYYDGLVFERTVLQESQDPPGQQVKYIEAGCPVGSGDEAFNGLGYWLLPECDNQTVTHEEGTVGFCHGVEKDTAACSFYIMLGKAPLMDKNYTVFGSVTRGLEVARKIFEQPTRKDNEFPDGDRPVKPVVIKKVTLRSSEDKAP